MNPVEILLDQSGDFKSFIGTFGGELERDGYSVKILQAIGQDRGYRIAYGKNLVGLEVTEDISSVVTRYYTLGTDGVSGGYVDSTHIEDYVHPKIDVYENKELTTASELQAAVKSLFDAGIDLPTVNIAVDFILLQNTEEYKNYAVLENVFLGDVVTVINQKMNFSKKAKVISYEYDSMLCRYNKIELGNFLPTIYSSITSGESVSKGLASTSAGLSSHIARTDNPHKVSCEQINAVKWITSSGYDDLEAFVAATAVNPVLAGCVKLKDVNNIFGQGKNIWVRVWYCYQNFYGSEWGCDGMIILSRATNVKVGFITGKKGEGFSLTWGTWS